MNPQDLDQSLDALFEERLDRIARRDLEGELRKSPQARDAYWETLLLHQSLRYRSKRVDLTKVVPMDQVICPEPEAGGLAGPVRSGRGAHSERQSSGPEHGR